MSEFFNATFSFVNIIPTGFLIFTLIYWISVLIGMLDMSFLDFNVHHDVNTHFHVNSEFSINKDISFDKAINKDISIDKVTHSELDVSWLNGILIFFNLGRVPFMVFLTFWAVPMWFISVVGNFYLGITSIFVSLLLLIPNLFMSLFISKLLTQPLVGIFTKLDADEKDDAFEGKIGNAFTNLDSEKPGQVEIENRGVHIRINAITMEGKEILRDTEVVVIQYLKDKELYLVDELD